MSHGDRVDALPAGFEPIARTAERARSPPSRTASAASTASSSTPRWSTPRGARRCSAPSSSTSAALAATWTMTALRRRGGRADPQRRSGDGQRHLRALRRRRLARSPRCSSTARSATGCTASSSTTALLRTGEREQVEALFADRFHLPLVTVDARERFLDELAGVTDPEKKRKIIGREFIDVFEEAARDRSQDAQFLAQGTLYPDVIESVSFKGPSRHHQEPPQRRRPARADEAQAGRAAARAVQGRGPRARPRARAARRDAAGASRSPARASRSAASAR